MIVVDASAWVRALVDSGPLADACRSVLEADRNWLAPSHTPLEVMRTIRRYEQAKLLNSDQATTHIEALCAAQVRYVDPEHQMFRRVWDHRHNISIYDAPYVAAAQLHNATLVTLDERLARAGEAAGIDVLVPRAM